MKKICFVIQRYGVEVNGGAELLCRQMAEHLLPFYDVHVFTTKARDYITWKNEYRSSLENVNGVTVHRFSNRKRRNERLLGELNTDFERYVAGNREKEMEWLKAQGPYCPDLVDAVRKNRDEYSCFIFFTYLYYPTVAALPLVKDKAILVPTAHDEPFIHMSLLKEIFTEGRAIFYMTDTEKTFVNQLFHNENIKSEIGGSGIEVPDDLHPERTRRKYRLKHYLIYAGRVDQGKNVPLLVRYFHEYCRRNETDLQLVLVGKKFVEIEEDERVKALGFVSDQDKYDLEAGAEALVLPSYYESLSLVVLEAMKIGIPVIASAHCEVVRQHCIRSDGGLYYSDYFEFEGILNWMKKHPQECLQLGKNGMDYVRTNYAWDTIIGKIRRLIEKGEKNDGKE